MNDEELNKLLAPLRAQEPSEFEMHKWELAMKREFKGAQAPGRREWFRMATALLVGIAIGALFFRAPAPESDAIQMAHATFERSHANLD